MNMTKCLSAVLLLVIALFVSAVSAQALSITEVQVSGVELDANNAVIHADRGDIVDIRVELKGGSTNQDKVKVKAWIGGYKYDEVEATTDRFNTLANVTYIKSLELEIPEDLDATDDYTLHIVLYDDDEAVEYASAQYALMITPLENQVKIQDVIFNPGLTVQAGKALYAKVRVENLGSSNERDIRVKLAIPELGIEVKDYVDKLNSDDYCDENDCDESHVSTSSELMLKIPDTAKEGSYQLKVTAEYDKLHKSTESTYYLYVAKADASTGITTTTSTAGTSIGNLVNVDTVTKELKQGEGVIYRFTLANLGNKVESYNVEVVGTDSWGSSRVDPAVVTVSPNGVGEAFVYITANKEASEGLYMFTAKVKSGSDVVKEISLGADVKANASGINLKNVLWGITALLVLVIVALGIVLAVKSAKGKKEEPSLTEGQTYYYYPNF
ncbi:MAG: hypothetical protein PHD81_00110 [Candidatus Nanoarchaeia archaeon]|nr:hypothetical protein [Candidatus Nanoarchaeia archaeon]MDD5587495.1 hypothetical protein [Candidatus Nanoarchaeia archaeon]